VEAVVDDADADSDAGTIDGRDLRRLDSRLLMLVLLPRRASLKMMLVVDLQEEVMTM
jgi:hypothetical protein